MKYRYFPSNRLAYSCLFVCLFFFIPFYISDKFYIQYIKNASQDLEDLRNNIIHSIQVHSLSTALGGRGSCYSRFSRDVTAAMLVYGTIAEKVEKFDSIIMQNLGDILPLFCTPTWPCHHVSKNQEFPFDSHNFFLGKNKG